MARGTQDAFTKAHAIIKKTTTGLGKKKHRPWVGAFESVQL